MLRRVYRFSSAECSNAIRALISSRSVVVDRPAVELGLSLLDAGGDFADGVIAMAGSASGGAPALDGGRPDDIRQTE